MNPGLAEPDAAGTTGGAGTSGTFTVAESVELAVVERNGFVESRHAGSAVIVSADGEVLRVLGNGQAPVFPRSSMKPFQAIAVMASGVELEGAEATIATASHAGTPAHLDLVRGLLARAGLDESALACPADWPLDGASRNALIAAGGGKSPICMTCSGKHAAMLLACVQNGWSTTDYLDPRHPLQAKVRDVLERLTGDKVGHLGIDGCGTPIYGMSLTALARGVARISGSSPSSPFALYRSAGVLVRSVRENGWAIDGPGRANTLVVERLGVFAKWGAEGVMVMSAPNGTTVALKVLDGNTRAVTIVALRLLQDAGALDAAAVDALVPELDLAILGGGQPVGAIRVPVPAL
ncbi:asparaginase [Compostimonas suwonensis]|uniref:Asparaginase n=1 Tax=Compostimonas suwonensis TaxID=1048394 RepID=A0A2M9BUC6_9MICO|nr:asparaginase [Compostimonas suwonensis]PJJ61556.1 asparaginase [Compostimonas suwonensis]